ncbi:hypothetical protein SCOCK_30422 [Actinacidiphila cocklensis]|uniref:Uncharacterized protein n=1 Tax=Actinacidiphila cocklensis TaxID=887465 RepID=A0A9W4DS26_9ACTN|nr:hypothetical protein SCOCK_30422 [Actinacidiphila cocklensis]
MRGCFAAFWAGRRLAVTTLHEVGREVKSVKAAGAGRGRERGNPAVQRDERGSGVVAEAEGFEPSMDGKAQTALAVRRHRPD